MKASRLILCMVSEPQKSSFHLVNVLFEFLINTLNTVYIPNSEKIV